MKLRARWTGSPPPKVGDYLMSTQRPRFAYRICKVTHVDRLVGWDPVLKTEFQHYKITAERKALYTRAHEEEGTPSERAEAKRLGIDWRAWSASSATNSRPGGVAAKRARSCTSSASLR